MTIEFEVQGLRIESANTILNKHWRIRKAAKDEQRELVYWAYRYAGRAFVSKPWGKRPLTITLTRIAPRRIDEHDNLRLGFKATVDMLTELVGAKSDADKRLTWVYAQQKGVPKFYGIRVKITSEAL